MKTCGRCSETKTLDEFNKDRTRDDSYHPYCRSCRKTEKADHYNRNKAAHALRVKAYRAANPDVIRAAARKRRARKLEEVRAYAREWAMRKYYRNIEESRQKNSKQQRRWRAANYTHALASHKVSRRRAFQRDPEGTRLKGAAKAAKRRCRMRLVTAETVDLQRIVARDRMRCHICRKKVRKDELHFDHVIPIAAGGTHEEANIAVSHATCNLKKHAKVLTLF